MDRRSFLPLVALVVLAFVGVLAGARLIGPPAPSAYYVFGHGPTVVFVHGLGSRIEHWLPTARQLAHDHRVVLVQLPGHGESQLPAPFTLERAAQSLDAALDRVADGPVVLVGHSLGGLVAAQVALDHPARVRRLVLVETALKPPFTPDERRAMLDALYGDYDRTIREAYTAFGRDSLQGRALADEVAHLDPDMMRAWIELALTADLSERIAALSVPALAVVSERTWPEGESWMPTAEAIGYDRARGVRVERFAGCGHFVMLDRPADLARSIERFAAGTVTPAIARTPAHDAVAAAAR